MPSGVVRKRNGWEGGDMEQEHTIGNIRAKKGQDESKTAGTDEFRNVEVGVGYLHGTVHRQKGMSGEVSDN